MPLWVGEMSTILSWGGNCWYRVALATDTYGTLFQFFYTKRHANIAMKTL